MIEERKINLQLFAEEGEPKEGATQGDNEGNEGNEGNNDVLTMEAVQKMIQSETDRVRTEYSNKYKALESEKEKLLKEKMTEEEKKKFEFDKLQKQLEEQKSEITQRELNLKAVDLLKENELNLDFRQFVVGKDEESTIKKVETLKKVWQNALDSAIQAKFKENGRELGDNQGKKDEVDIDNMSIEQYKEYWKKRNK